MAELYPYWISWWWVDDHGSFEIHSPWWVTGSRNDGEDSVCAAVMAADGEDAKEIIYRSYDKRPEDLEFRFIEMKHKDWSPFSSRFQRALWMRWPNG